MQISINYKNLKSIDIEDKKITGIVSNNVYDINELNRIIFDKCKDNIGLISIADADDMHDGSVYDFIMGDNNIDYNEILKKVDINLDLLSKDLSICSTCEKIKILFAKTLIMNPNIILIDGILEVLDSKLRKKFIKIIIELNKFYNKTLVVSSIDIDIIFEYIDNLIIIDDECTKFYDKYLIYDEKEFFNNSLINMPFVVKIENMILNKSNINLGKNDNVNELIKAIYREIR